MEYVLAVPWQPSGCAPAHKLEGSLAWCASGAGGKGCQLAIAAHPLRPCYRYWNAASSEALIAEHYPFFLDFYRTNITLANEKSDVIRYVLMDQFGGARVGVLGSREAGE